MALALNSSNPLAGNIISLIGVDPSSGVLVDLKRTGVTFTLDAGVTYVDTALGRGVRTAGSAENAAGFTISPAITQNTFGAHEMTIFMVVHKMTGRGSNGSQPARLPVHFMNGMSVGFDISTGNVGLNPGANTNANIVQATPAKTLVDSTFHSLTVRQWNASAGWNTLEGDLYIDGAYSNASYTGGMTGNTSTDVNITGFAKSFASSWQGDFVWMVVFNKKLSPAEISDLHASLGASNAFGLVSGGAAAASPPSGTVTINTVTAGTTSASVNYSYSGSDATGYQYRLNGGAATALGASPATISGLTASTAYTLEVRATNATGNGAWSAVSNFTTAAPAGDTTAPTLSGVPSFSAITSSGYTVTWTAGTDAVGVTGYEVQVASGGWTNVGNVLTTAITGRTAGATETVQVRAYDAAGNRSAAISAGVTLASAVVTGTLTVAEPLKNNTGTVRASLSGIKAVVIRASDMVAVLTKTGLTTNASGLLSAISDANLVAGTQYHVVIKLSDGGVGVSAPIAAA